MQPQHTPKPVMDVTAPPHPTTLPEPAPMAAAAVPPPVVPTVPAATPEPQPVDAPMPTHSEATPVATPPPSAADDQATDTTESAALPAIPERKPLKPVAQSNTPVTIIVMTILAMFILSGLAVMVYLTSQS